VWHDFTLEEKESQKDSMINPINFKMVGHPMNWLTIMLMVIIAGAIGHYLFSLFGIEANNGQGNNVPANGQVPISQVTGQQSS
jgi:hypothetical protein